MQYGNRFGTGVEGIQIDDIAAEISRNLAVEHDAERCTAFGHIDIFMEGEAAVVVEMGIVLTVFAATT